MISDERVEKSVTYMVGTDEGFAMAKSYMVGLEKQEKTILGMAILNSEQSGQQAKEAEARNSEAYTKWRKDYEDAVFNFEIVRNKRHSETLVVDCWRSFNSNKKKGNI